MALAPDRLRAALERLWWRDPAPALPWMARLLLQPLAALYRLLLARRLKTYRTHPERRRSLGVPTLVVGNRIVGGAGKTPCTLALLSALQARGWHPGVVSRGYGRTQDGVRGVHPQLSTPAEVGDEPLLTARRSGVPVWVGRDRHAAGRALLAAHPEVDLVICDDGLQHWRLARDFELVVFDERGSGNGRLLPLGPLREALDTPSFARRQWTVHNRANEIAKATASAAACGDNDASPRNAAGAWLAQRHLGGVLPLADWWGTTSSGPTLLPWPALRHQLQGRRVTAVAGIGEPERFFRALENQGLALDRRPCADHADHLELPFPASACEVIVTEKDAVKLAPDRLARERPGSRVWVAPLSLNLPEALIDDIDTALKSLRAENRPR